MHHRAAEDGQNWSTFMCNEYKKRGDESKDLLSWWSRYKRGVWDLADPSWVSQRFLNSSFTFYEQATELNGEFKIRQLFHWLWRTSGCLHIYYSYTSHSLHPLRHRYINFTVLDISKLTVNIFVILQKIYIFFNLY